MTTQFATPTIPTNWAESRETHEAIAVAIHAISDDKRAAEDIWADPSSAEFQNVAMAVENYAASNLYDIAIGDELDWGMEAITVGA